jgi:hypothetical protein
VGQGLQADGAARSHMARVHLAPAETIPTKTKDKCRDVTSAGVLLLCLAGYLCVEVWQHMYMPQYGLVLVRKHCIHKLRSNTTRPPCSAQARQCSPAGVAQLLSIIWCW